MSPTTQTLTQTIPAGARPLSPITPGNDPHRGWLAVTHQLGIHAPRAQDNIRRIRQAMMSAVRV